MPFPIALAASLLPAAYQGIKGLVQKGQAKDLKESTYIPEELLMNRDLAKQQAFSRRAPGSSQAESNNRRAQANQISAGQRSFGGDANKLAAVTAGATAQTADANARVATAGQQFSEGAYGRLANANAGIAGQKRQNRDEYNRAKESLLYASDQNIFNAIQNTASAGLTAYLNGDIGGGGGRVKTQSPGDEIGGQLGKAANKGARGSSTITSNPWQDYQGNQMMQQGGYNPYNWGQQQYQNGGVWRLPGYSAPAYNMNVAPRPRIRMSSRKPY